MPIQINNDELEAALDALRLRQVVRVSRTRMAVEVILGALARCEETGDPEAWRWPMRRNGNGSPSIPERTAHDPAPEPVSSSTADQAVRRPTAAGQAPAPETEP